MLRWGVGYCLCIFSEYYYVIGLMLLSHNMRTYITHPPFEWGVHTHIYRRAQGEIYRFSIVNRGVKWDAVAKFH